MSNINSIRVAIAVLWVACFLAAIFLWQTADLIYTRESRNLGDVLGLLSLWAISPAWIVTWIRLGRESESTRRRGRIILKWFAATFLSVWFAMLILKLWSNL